MKGLDIKATIYDIFGYLLPGLLVIAIILVSFQHTYGLFNITYISEKINLLNGIEFTLVFFLAYILGHSLSSISSIIIEKNLIWRFKLMSNSLRINELLSEALSKKLKNKFKDITNSEFSDKDFRFLITYVESKQPAVYSTAFVYLAFYGMARSIAFTFCVGLVWESVNILVLGYKESIIFLILYFVLVILFYFQYFRFLRYFREQIAMGFILPS